jgi:uncharacterized protein
LQHTGRLYDDAEHFLDAFLPNAEVHYSIIEAIARGEQTWSRITSRVGRDGGSLLRPSQWLQDMQLIRRVVPITEANAAASKRTVYKVLDPYLTFWHRFIAPLVSYGGANTTDGKLPWSSIIAPRLDDYIGEVFENTCRDFVREGGIPRFKPIRTGRWWDATASNEIDIVALDARGQLLVAECKWGQIDSRDLKRLRERTVQLATELKGISTIKYVLFSRRTPTDRELLSEIESGQVSWRGIADLFQ